MPVELLRKALTVASALLLPSSVRTIAMSSSLQRLSIDRSAQRITIAHDTSTGAKAQASVIVLHGLGDTAQGWADVASMWAEALPSIRFVLPTAPTRPVTLNGGMAMPAWYDIVSLDGDRADQSCEGLDASKAAVDKIIDDEAAVVGGASRVLVAGFSQGGALALYTGLRRTEEPPLAGILCMSGYLPKAESWAVENSAKRMPVMLCHGDSDPVVLPAWALKTREALAAQGVGVKMKVYPGMVHSACDDEIKDALNFIRASLPAPEAAPPDGGIEGAGAKGEL